MSVTEIKRGLCGMCRGQCAIRAAVTGGKITKLEADTDSPRGRLCARGALAPSVIYGKDRILHPLIRTGEKGEGKFRRATWEEALDHAAAGFQKILDSDGSRALASYFGQGVLERTINRAGTHFWQHIGSPNDTDCGSICNVVSRKMAPILTLGLYYDMLSPDIEHCDAAFVWGKNPVTDDGAGFVFQRLLAARQRGAKIIVIDPRKSGMGEYADLWIPITPGSDGALALAMLKLIIGEEKYDREIAENYSTGFPELCGYLDSLELSSLLAECGISEETLRQLTDIFCSTEKIPLISYTGVEYQLSGVQNIRAILLLWALTGKIDAEGGMYVNAEKAAEPALYQPDPANLPLGCEQFPLFTAFTGCGQFSVFPQYALGESPYPVRGLLMAGGSPAVTYPDSKRWKEAYQKLSYMAVLERYMTEDAKYADVIFPVTTWYENASVLPVPRGYRLRRPLIEPLGECRNDIFVLQALAERMGFGDELPRNNDELCLWALNGNRELLERLKAAPDETLELRPARPRVYRKYLCGRLRQDGRNGFPTPSGKIEIRSSILEKFGYEGLPVYHSFRSLPGMDGYPLMLTTGARGKIRIGSFGQNIPEMAVFEPYPAIELSQNDAETFGVRHGESVKVVTPFGEKCFRVHICAIAEGSAHIPFGGGSSFMEPAWADGNVNDLCSLDYRDPISGFVTIKSIPCRIEKQSGSRQDSI